MRIDLTSIFVNNLDNALAFYTDVLGFLKKMDVPAGNARWITVVSPEVPDGVQLVLEPNSNPAALAYQQSLFEQGIPATAFTVASVQKEYERLEERGVEFTVVPQTHEWGSMAIFKDTVGNLIQIQEVTM